MQTFFHEKKLHETDHEWFHGKGEEEQNECVHREIKIKKFKLNAFMKFIISNSEFIDVLVLTRRRLFLITGSHLAMQTILTNCDYKILR
jgi:hypothetical protein